LNRTVFFALAVEAELGVHSESGLRVVDPSSIYRMSASFHIDVIDIWEPVPEL